MKKQEANRIEGIHFFSAAQLRRENGVSRTTARMIASQPGYRRGERMSILKTKGGYRLYCEVGGKWMDASLNDLEVTK